MTFDESLSRKAAPSPQTMAIVTAVLRWNSYVLYWSPHVELDHAYRGMNSASSRTIRRYGWGSWDRTNTLLFQRQTIHQLIYAPIGSREWIRTNTTQVQSLLTLPICLHGNMAGH